MTLKLLVADDSVTIHKVVGLAFSGEDVEIESVFNGNAALDKVKSFRPDIVLADVFMPGHNGYDICERIKDDPELTHIPVVLLAGTFEPFDERESLRVKCSGYLIKPFETSELIQTIRSLTGEKTMPQAADVYSSAFPDSSKFIPGIRGLVSSRVMESFLGSSRILDLFDSEVPGMGTAAGASDLSNAAAKIPEASNISSSQAKESPPVVKLSEQALNAIVDKVVRRMSVDVIREVAWEVVPDLSEVIIRRTIEENRKS
jgi:CheY-like chemotaxis protein